MPFPAAPSTFKGQTGTLGVAYNLSTAAVPAGLKSRLYDKKIVDWRSDLYPSASVVMMNNKKTKAGMDWSRWERKPFPHWLTLEAAVTAAGTNFSSAITASGDIGRTLQYDLWMNVRTREVVHFPVAALTTVTRSIGSVPAQAMVVGDKLVKVNSSHPGGSTAPLAQAVLEDQVLFYATHHMKSVEATADMLAHGFEIEPNRFRAMREYRRIEFTDEMKRSYFISDKSSTAGTPGTNAEQQNTVAGLVGHCTTWTHNFNGLLSRPDFFGFVADGPGRYIQGDIGIAMSSLGLAIVNDWLTDAETAEVGQNKDTLGFEVKNLRMVAGRRAKLFHEAWLDEDPTTQGWMFVFPLNKTQGSAYCEVNGPGWSGKVRLVENVKREDFYLGRKDVWYACYGWDHGPEIGYGFGYGIEG